MKRLVKLSVWGAAGEAYSFAKIHRPIERAVEVSGLAWTFLRPNGFMQNSPRPTWRDLDQGAGRLLPARGGREDQPYRRARHRAGRGAGADDLGHEGKAYELRVRGRSLTARRRTSSLACSARRCVMWRCPTRRRRPVWSPADSRSLCRCDDRPQPALPERRRRRRDLGGEGRHRARADRLERFAQDHAAAPAEGRVERQAGDHRRPGGRVAGGKGLPTGLVHDITPRARPARPAPRAAPWPGALSSPGSLEPPRPSAPARVPWCVLRRRTLRLAAAVARSRAAPTISDDRAGRAGGGPRLDATGRRGDRAEALAGGAHDGQGEPTAPNRDFRVLRRHEPRRRGHPRWQVVHAAWESMPAEITVFSLCPEDIEDAPPGGARRPCS